MHITYRCKFPSCGDVPNNEESVKSVEQGEPPISTPLAPQCSIPGTHATGSSSMAHVGTVATTLFMVLEDTCMAVRPAVRWERSVANWASVSEPHTSHSRERLALLSICLPYRKSGACNITYETLHSFPDIVP